MMLSGLVWEGYFCLKNLVDVEWFRVKEDVFVFVLPYFARFRKDRYDLHLN